MNKEKDYQINAGFKGVAAGWNWDLGYGYGQDHVNLYTIDTVGLSFETNGLPTPSGFYDGFLEATQAVTTLDFNRDFEVGMAGPLNVAFGLEYRHEFYEIGAGIPESYIDGGASSFPGFTPANAGSNDRKNESIYVDLAGKPIDNLTVDLAGRHEHYSDFGSATVGKLTARYDFTPAVCAARHDQQRLSRADAGRGILLGDQRRSDLGQRAAAAELAGWQISSRSATACSRKSRPTIVSASCSGRSRE